MEVTPKTEAYATIQTNTATFEALHNLANIEKRTVQTLVDEALCEYVARKENIHKEAMSAFERSTEQYDELYKKLAK